MDRKLTVARGYDHIAEGYLRWRQALDRERDLHYVERLTERLTRGARILDLGCGAGKPVAAHLSERFDVVGIDISRAQARLARRFVPAGAFLVGDMCAPPFAPASFEAIVALYSIIHVPREEHGPLLSRLFDWLRPRGRLLAVMGSSDWEGSESDWLVSGVEMFWSHFGADASLKLVEQAGLRVLASNIEPDSLGGAHLFVLAERPG